MYVADGSGVAAGGGAAAVILGIIAAVARGAYFGARSQHYHRTAERRHQETLAAIRGTRHAPVRPAPTLPRPTPRPVARVEPANLVEQAARLVITSQQGSPAMLTRKLGVSWTRAVGLMAELHRAGIVGADSEYGSPRDVLVGPDGLEAALARVRGAGSKPIADRRGENSGR